MLENLCKAGKFAKRNTNLQLRKIESLRQQAVDNITVMGTENKILLSILDLKRSKDV